MNQSIYVKKNKPQVLTTASVDFSDQKKIEQIKNNDLITPNKDFLSLAERLAQSSIYYRNYYFKNNEAFRFKPHHFYHYISKMFPYSRFGRLFIDEPFDQLELDICFEKRSVLWDQEMLYVIIERDSKLDTLLTQVEEFKKYVDKRNLGAKNKT